MNPGADLSSWFNYTVDDNKQFSCVISDLHPNQKYSVKMSASTKVGDGPVSAVVETKTQQGLYLHYECHLKCLKNNDFVHLMAHNWQQ